jgi:predicted TIM-barrel fold metal-dependent hydrolase
MEVIDVHVHIGTVDNWTPWVTEYFKQNNPYYYGRFCSQITPEEVIAFFKSQGVDRAVMLSEYAPKTSGVVTNEYTSAFCKGHKELIPFGCICLYNNVSYVEQAKNAVENLGVKGFKLLPSYQHFYPNNQEFFPFYEYVQSEGLPIMFHTGTSIFKGSRIKYADPLLLDDVADEFSHLNIIMEHGGRPFWYDRAAWLISRHKNMHIGTAGTATRQLLKNFPNFEKFQDRFIFGSDWPGFPDVKSLIEKMRALPIGTEAKEKILGKNMKRLLKSG